jgi:hypothetical protein
MRAATNDSAMLYSTKVDGLSVLVDVSNAPPSGMLLSAFEDTHDRNQESIDCWLYLFVF